MRRLPVVLLSFLAAALCACATPPANVPAPQPAPPGAPESQREAPQPAPPVPSQEPAPNVTPIPLPGAGSPVPATPSPAPGSEAGATAQSPAEGIAGGPPVAVALLLPAQSTPFARAAEAVRLGFFAAHSVANANVAIQMIELEDTVNQLKSGLATAQKRGVRMVVGPLTRTLVNALGDGRVAAPLPMLALNTPENDAAFSPDALAFGLSVETEARQMVRLAMREIPAPAATSVTPRFLVLAGESPLDRRMAAAFRDALRERGERATQIDVRVGYTVLQTLTEQLAALRIDAVFCALDAREAAFVRPRLPREVPLYATSQVNLGGAEAALLAPDLEGVKFVDMPWLIDPQHAAVMVYPKPEIALSGELQRLYALGIDAYRVMLEWLAGRRAFDVDGVTGRLHVDRARSARVERWPTVAVFRSGKTERLEQIE